MDWLLDENKESIDIVISEDDSQPPQIIRTRKRDEAKRVVKEMFKRTVKTPIEAATSPIANQVIINTCISLK